MGTTTSSNRPRNKCRRQCKDESLEKLVTVKAKKEMAVLGYIAEIYNVSWNILVRKFGKPQMVVKAQLERIYSSPPMESYDGAAMIKLARILSSRVNVFTQFSYVGDLNSEGVLGSATRQLTHVTLKDSTINLGDV